MPSYRGQQKLLELCRRLIELRFPPCGCQRERLQRVAHSELVDRLEQDKQARLVDQRLLVFQIERGALGGVRLRRPASSTVFISTGSGVQ